MKVLKEGTEEHTKAVEQQKLITKIAEAMGGMYHKIDTTENLDRLTMSKALFNLKGRTHNFQAQLVFTSDVDEMIDTEDIVSMSNKSGIEEAEVVEEKDPNQLELNLDENEK